MGVILADGLTINGTPLIGYDNIVTTTNIASTTEEEGFPVTNLANPATHLKWKGTAAYSNGALLHFELSGDSPDHAIDSSPFAHTWTLGGNVFMDPSQFKFGTRSARFDGTTDYIDGDGDGGMAFGSNDFTIDFWVRLNSIGTDKRFIDTRPDGTTNGPYISLEKPAANTLLLFVSGATRITGTTALTTGVWYHIALTRSGTNTTLFLNGVQEGSIWTTDTTVYEVGASRPRLGARGDSGGSSPGSSLDGWMDELRVINGEAIWSANSPAAFTVPTSAYDGLLNEYITITDDIFAIGVNYIALVGHNFGTTGALVSVEVHDSGVSPDVWSELIAPQFVSDDLPIIFHFDIDEVIDVESATAVRVRIQPASTVPQAAVMYSGDILDFGRGVKADVEHVPITYGRRTSIVNGMSESGNFLGRIVLGESRETKAEFFGFEKDFYVDDIDEFVAFAQESPFFFAYAPVEYPAETGFVWLVNDAEPGLRVDTGTRVVSLTLQMRGVA